MGKKGGDHIRSVVLIVCLFQQWSPLADVPGFEISTPLKEEVDRIGVCHDMKKGPLYRAADLCPSWREDPCYFRRR